MATKRTNEFDADASQEHQRSIERSSQADIVLGEFLKKLDSGSTTPPPPPQLTRAPRGTVPPPPAPAPVAEVLVNADTIVTPNPVLSDDHIELSEESGLLQLEPPDQDLDDAVEVSLSFLIDDLEGSDSPVGGEAPALAAQGAEEIASEYLAFVETQGEIHDVDKPRCPISDGPSVDIAGLHYEALNNRTAQYSDGIPTYKRRSQGLSSKTLRVRAPKAPGHRPPLRQVVIAAVFAAGIGVGIGFAMHAQSGADGSAADVPATEPAAVIVPEPAQAATPAAIEPVVVALDEAEADLALAMYEKTADALREDQELVAKALKASALEADADAAMAPWRHSEADELAPRKKKSSRHRVKSAAIQARPAATAGDPGVLMLAAKPPCQIHIDGNKTGLTTPQRLLRLSPGGHRITLTNREHQIRDSFKVSIVSGKKTRIVRDNTSKIK